jgi:hypothetical protein
MRKRLVGVIEGHTLPFYEYNLPKLPGENKNHANARRLQRYRTARIKCIERFTTDLIIQWPTAIDSSGCFDSFYHDDGGVVVFGGGVTKSC